MCVHVIHFFIQEHYKQINTIKLSPDGTELLIGYEAVELFRHSMVAKYDIFNLKTKWIDRALIRAVSNGYM